MPFRSQSQRRKFYSMAERHEISPKVVKEWESATPKGKLPEKVAMIAFVDEVEKIALDIRLHTDPVGSALRTELIGAYFNPEEVKSNPVRMALAKGRPHLIAMAPHEDIKSLLKMNPTYANTPEAGMDLIAKRMHHALQRHELTHYMRGKLGKTKGVGKPGVMNVLRSLREETAGFLSGGKALAKTPTLQKRYFQVMFPSIAESVRKDYAATGGVRKAIMGGTLGKVLGAFKR